MFVLRAVFWLTIIAFILPVAAGGRSDSPPIVHDANYRDGYTGNQVLVQTRADEPEVHARDLLLMAAQSANDLLGFCDRNPDVCVKSRAIAWYVGQQTLYYGGQAVSWLAARINGGGADEVADEAAGRQTPRTPERLAGA